MEPQDPRTDEAVLAALGQRLSAARIARDLTQAQLAQASGVSKRTVERMEAGQSAQLTSFIRVLRTLELLDALESLLPPPRPGPMDLLRLAGKPPQRASGGHEPSGEPWRWGEES